MAKHPAILACRIALCLCGASALPGCGGGPMEMTLAPVATTGTVQTTVINRRSTDGSSELTVQEGFGIGVDSYLWHPWFAQVNGSVDFSHEKTFGAEGGSSFRGSADATLSVLPQSKYPVTLGVSHSDSRASGEFSSIDFTRDSAFINARAVITQNLSGGLRASWSRTDQTDTAVQTTQVVNLTLNQTFPRDKTILGISAIDLNVGLNSSNLVASSPDEDDNDHQVAIVQLGTRSEPFENLFYDTRITAIYDDEDDGDDATTRESLQGISTLQWRPENKPFVVTGSLRTLTEQISRDGNNDATDSKTLLAAGNLGVRWPVNDRLSFNLGLRGSYEDITREGGSSLGESDLDDGERVNATVNAGVNYNSEPRQLSGFEWRWDARAASENGIRSDEGVITRESLGLGHRFERMLEEVIFVPVRFSFAQDLDLQFDADGDDPISAGLSDSITFSHSQFKDATSTTARLFLRDSRELIGETREFQLIQARLGRRVAINRDRRLQGDLSMQTAREVNEDETDIFFTMSGNLSYDHRNLFEIENLGLRSELRINLVNLDELFGESTDDLDSEFLRNDWRNILTYRIGRLTANVEATVFQRDEGFGYLALFRFRRDFGGGK